MGCGASADPQLSVQQAPPQQQQQPAAAPQQPQAKPAAKPKAAPKAPAPGTAGGGGSLKDFLEGLGVRDVPKATAALKGAGIETRGDFFTLDKGMREELDGELKNGGVSLGDRAKIKKAENSGITVKQGNGEVTVLALKPGQAMQTASSLERVFLGMGWTDKGKAIDVDASCIAFNSGNAEETIYFSNLGNKSKSLKHSGDILSGSDAGKEIADLERIYAWLPNLPASIDCLVFVCNVYTAGANFSDLKDAYIRMANADTNQEMARMTLGGPGMKGNAIVFAKVYRCGPKGPWHFQCLGMPMNVENCASIDMMIPELVKNGCAYSPPGAQPAPAPGAPGKAPAVAPGAAGDTPEAKKKAQRPTGVYVAGALAVAGVAGIAAATLIFTSDGGLDASNFAPSQFESGVDFGNLVPCEDTICGIGEGIADGAEDAFGWAGDVVADVDMAEIGNTIGSAAGDAAGLIGEGAGAAAGMAGDAAGWAAGAAGDAMNSDAMANAQGALGDAGGMAMSGAQQGFGMAQEGAGTAFGAVQDATPGIMAGAGDAAGMVGGAAQDGMGMAGDAMGEAPGALAGVADAMPDMEEAAGMFGGLVSALGGLFGGGDD